MSENNNAGQTGSSGDSGTGSNAGGQGGGTGSGQLQTLDVASLSEEQLLKVLEDQRIWKTKRMSELLDHSKKYQQTLDQQKKDQELSLIEQKKHEELAQLRAKERDEWKSKADNQRIDNLVIIEATKAGISDVDAALKLIDRAKITIDDKGDVAGVADVVSQLIKDKPYLKGKSTPMGSGTNPLDGGNGQQFTMTQIQDPVFYQAHEKEIRLAISQGKVKEDRF